MNKLDLFILIPVALGFFFGFSKGFFKELASIIAIFLGIYIAKWLAPSLSSLIGRWLGLSATTSLAVTYLAIFILVIIGLNWGVKILDSISESVSLSGVNKLLGGCLGALKFGLLVSIVLIVMDTIDSKVPFIQPSTKEASVCYKPVLKLAPFLWGEAKKMHEQQKL